MEEAAGKKCADPSDPLLVSVRSGAALSMPGMMNTILNLGLTDASVEGLAKKTGNPRFAYDGYRRLIDMFGSTAMGVEHEAFEHELEGLKKERGVKLDTEGRTATTSRNWSAATRAVYENAFVKEPFPQDPKDRSSGRRSWRGVPIVGWARKPSKYRQGSRGLYRLEGNRGQCTGHGLWKHRQRLGHRGSVYSRPQHGRG